MTWSQIIVVGWLQFALASFGILWLARWALRRMPQPVDRSRIIQCTLAATTLLPLLIVAAPWPAWRLEIVSPVEDVEQAVTAIPSQDFLPQEPPQSPFVSGQISPFAIDEIAMPPRPEVAETVITNQPPTIEPSPPKVKPDVSRPRILGGQVWTMAMVLIIVLHAAALICFLGLRCLGGVQLRRLCRTATTADDALIQTWNRLTQQQGKNVRLLVSPSLDVPLMFGWRHPVVLIPRKLVDAGGAALSYCLVHEWAHIEQHDFLAWRCVDACQILFWLQPAYWSLRKELRLCQDLLADNRSTRASGDAIEYSALLVDFARQQMVVPVAGALTFMDQPSQLTRRVKMLLERTFLVRTRCTWKLSLAAVTTVGLLVLMISAMCIEATRAEDSKDKAETANAAESPAVKTDKPADPANESPEALKYTCSVVDKDTGQGIPNARVAVRRMILTPQANRILEESKHVTDAEGKYVIHISSEQIAEERLYIDLDVEHDDYGARNGRGYGLNLIRKNEKLGQRPFFETTKLSLAEPVTGKVISADGRPMAGVKVQGFTMSDPENFDTSCFFETVTAADGKFRLNCHKGAEAALWIVPKDHAPLEKFLAKQRGDLGELRLESGIRVAGRVLGVDQKPIAGVPVNINFSGESKVTLPVGTYLRRGVLSDAEGRFSFDPLSAGQYRLTIGDQVQDPLVRNDTRYPVTPVFVSRKVLLKADSQPAFQEIQAIPHVVIHAQTLNGKGEQAYGPGFSLSGRLDGELWSASAVPNEQGTIALKVPHGLQETRVRLISSEHGALRFRLGPHKPLRDDVHIFDLGTLNDDIEGFEIIQYKAPTVIVSAVDREKQPIKELQIKAKYAKPRPSQYIGFANESDIDFERQNGNKYRTSQMLPDEDVTFTITADGYSSVDEMINLKEGETKELIVALKKADGSEDEKTSSTAPAVLPIAVAKAVDQPIANIDEAAEPAKEPAVALKYQCSVVEKETGKGIPGAQVTLRRAILASVEYRILEESHHTTDSEGKYEIVIPPEQVVERFLVISMFVEHPDYSSEKLNGSRLSAILAKEKQGERPFFTRTELYPGEPVTGRVVSPEGTALAGVPVQFYAQHDAKNGRSSWRHDTVSEPDGGFHVNFRKGDDAAYWIIPKNYAPVERLLFQKRGDQGEIRLSPGIRLSGRVISVEQEPVAGVPVNITYSERSQRNLIPTSVQRGALSDAEGKFTFDPLLPGQYRLTIDDRVKDSIVPDLMKHPVTAVFLHRSLMLKADNQPAFVEIQAVPHVMVRVQFRNSKGEKTRGHSFDLQGTLDGGSWFGQGQADAHGAGELKVPYGLQDTFLTLRTTKDGALRYRLHPGEPLRDDVKRLKLGTINGDIEPIEIIEYKAPIVVISAVDEAGMPIGGLKIKGIYTPPRSNGFGRFTNGSDILFDRRNDGKYRSEHMLPDENLVLTVSAGGYQSAEQNVNLKEGETKELVVTLKKARAEDDKKTSAASPTLSPLSPKPSAELLKYTCSIVNHDTDKGILGARVRIRGVITSAGSQKIVCESKHLTDAMGNYTVELPREIWMDPTLHLEFDVEHDDYAAMERGFSFVAFAEDDEMRKHPSFERLTLLEGRPVTGVVVSPDGRPQSKVAVTSFWSTGIERRAWLTSYHHTQTDQLGRFRIAFPNHAEAVFWVNSNDFAPIERLVPKERGDLGRIPLSHGVRVHGTVVNVDGRPLPKTLVNIEYVGERNVGKLAVATNLTRGTFTDTEGRFAFNPLPSGTYRIEPGEYLQEIALNDLTRHPLKGIFESKKVTLKEGIDPGPQPIQAMPHVVFHAKFVDSAGTPTFGHQVAIFGKLDGQYWQSNTAPARQGEASIYVPHGLRAAGLRLYNHDLRAERYRFGNDKPLVSVPGEYLEVDLGTLNDDIDNFEIVRYQAPSVRISAVDQNRKPIPEILVQARYPWGNQAIVLKDGSRSDIGFDAEKDGRHKTARMLPDEDVTFTISAPGFASASEKINLKEGETKDLVVTLKESRQTTSDSSSK